MSAPNWNELKADGRVVVDAPARKLAVYTNPTGEMVFLSVEDGHGTYSILDPHEFDVFMAAFSRARQEAIELSLEMDVAYEAFQAIQSAKGR